MPNHIETTPPRRNGCVMSVLYVLAFLFVLVLPLALLAYNVGRVVFSPPLIKRVVADEVINSELLPIVLEWFSQRRAQERVDMGEALTGITEPDIVLLLSYMDRADWRNVKTEVLTAEILAGWVTDTVDATYAWIDTSDRVPPITWSLQPFKTRVLSEHGVAAIVIAYDNLPPCQQAEIDDFLARQAAVPAGTEVLYNLCHFPKPWEEDQFNDYVNALEDVVANIPATFALTRELQQSGDDTQGVGPEVLKQYLRLIRLLYVWAWVVPLVLWLLILTLGVRTAPQLGRWGGVPLVLGGLLAVLPAVLYAVLITSLLAAGPLSEVPPVVRTEATRAILRLAAEVFRPMLIQAIILTGVGLLLALLLFKRQPATQPQLAESAAPTPPG
ncbi:MAG: hypothetical protein IT317_19475 [Anaerolineales bacterium]|nr:hypothetical protein [Anaerolineales bacterium]